MESATRAARERPVVDAEAALRFLSEASTVLAGSLDYEATVRKVAELTVPGIADWCGIDVLQEDGTTRQITSGLDDRELEQFLLEMRRRYREGVDQSKGTAEALQGRAIVDPDATGEPLIGLSDEERALYERLAIQSYMIVPLIARDRTLGAVTLISRDPGRRYGPLDLAFAEHLARRFALAIDNARLYDEAERSLALLDTLFATAPIGLGFWDNGLRPVRTNDALAALPDMDTVLTPLLERVAQSGRAVTGLELENVGTGEGARDYLASAYPVRGSDGEVIGIGAVVADITERRQGAILLAQALEREREARAAAQAAERRARFLSEASVLLDTSLDYETTLENVARLVVTSMADWCTIDVLEPGGTFRNLAVAHRDPDRLRLAQRIQELYPSDTASDTGPAAVIRSGQSQLLGEITDEMLERRAVDAEHLELLRALEMRSLMIVPVVARGRTLGAISFIGGESGFHFEDDDLALAEELARRAGMAVDNARLYTELSGIADTLQAELLPTEIPDVPGIDVAVRYRAAGELNRVGGDFYDVFRRGPNQWAVVIGDVSGKGAPAAAVTALARYTLRTAAAAAARPSDALASLNEALLERRRDQEFCSVALAYVTLVDGGLEVAISLGGHPPAFVRRAGGGFEQLGEPGLLMGFLHDPPLSDQAAALAPGDTILLYTDGVPDAARDGDRFGDDRLEALVGGLPPDLPAALLAETIEETAVAHAGHQPQDDMALVVVQVPSDFERAAQFDCGSGPEAIGRARAAVTGLLDGQIGEDRLYEVQLLVSEVVTNAVRHGGARDSEHVDVRVALTSGEVRVEVRDPGPGFGDITPALPERESDGGYGLYLVELYSDGWGVSAAEGTCVWFELPRGDGLVEQT